MKLEQSAKVFFDALCRQIGEESQREGLRHTPERIAKAYADMLDGYAQNPTSVLGSLFEDGVCDEMIVLKNVSFYSMCEHHLLPFFGKISVGYIPDKKIVGISGLARLIESFTHRLQIQEKLTAQIADCLMSELAPKGVMIVCQARHLCLEMRGKHSQSFISTSALRGLFKKDSKTRAEFMQLIAR